MWRQCLFTTGLHWAVICTCLHFSAIQSKKSSLTPKTLCGKAERKGEWKWNVFYLQGCHNSKGIRTLNPKQQSFGTIWAAMRWEGQCKTHKLLKRKQNRCKNNAYCTRYSFICIENFGGEIGKSIGFFCRTPTGIDYYETKQQRQAVRLQHKSNGNQCSWKLKTLEPGIIE